MNLDRGFVQVPFPDGFRTADTSFDFFQQRLNEAGVAAANVAGVILETYQGGSAAFAPREYMRALRQWCDSHKILLVCDEVQAGFGRTGTLWGFEHYGIVPDLATFGKGITSSLPLAAVAGRADVMDLHPPGSMTSTHIGNPAVLRGGAGLNRPGGARESGCECAGASAPCCTAVWTNCKRRSRRSAGGGQRPGGGGVVRAAGHAKSPMPDAGLECGERVC